MGDIYRFKDYARGAMKALKQGKIHGFGGALSAAYQAGIAWGELGSRDKQEALWVGEKLWLALTEEEPQRNPRRRKKR